MSKKMLSHLDEFMLTDPDEGDVREFVKQLAYFNTPTDRTITVRYSQLKKYIRDNYPRFSNQFLKELNPPQSLTKAIIKENLERKCKKKIIKFSDKTIQKIYDLRYSKSPYERAIYLEFISGRRVGEIFDAPFKVTNVINTQVRMKLSKKSGKDADKFFRFHLIKDTATNHEFRDELNLFRTSTAGMDLTDLTNRINKSIRNKIDPNLSSHALRNMYAVYRFSTDNKDNLALIGYINEVLNHTPQSVDSSVCYSNFQYVKDDEE